jgi:flavin-dependent dehydrogenase
MPDLLIVGGGPAGLATSIFAARAGLSSVVVEARSLPLDKPCGEGVMPPGVALLEEMGVRVPHANFIGIRYVEGDTVAEGRFRGRPGWGVRRTALVAGLFDRAQELGVDVRLATRCAGWKATRDGVRVETHRGTLEGRFLVAADGLHSRIRKEASLERASGRGARRFGVRRHLEVHPWSSCVEVHWTDGVEAYLTPVGSNVLGVAFLSSGGPLRFDDALRRFPRLEERLIGAVRLSPEQGAGPFRQNVRRRYRGRLALVGDAAGYLDALTGEGLSLAFHCARALVAAIVDADDLADYERAYRGLSGAYYKMTGLLLAVARRPRLRQGLIATFADSPDIFDRLLSISNGERPLTGLGWGNLLGLSMGLARGLRKASPSRWGIRPAGSARSGTDR